MANARDKLWLVKVPAFVAEHLQNADANVEVGVLTRDDGASSGGRGGSSGEGGSFTLKLADKYGKLPPELPRELNLTLGPPAGPMHLLSEPKEAGKAKEAGKSNAPWRLEGKIERKGEVSAKALTSEYKALVASRVERASIKREIQEMPPEELEKNPHLGRMTVPKEEREQQQLFKVQKKLKNEKPAPLSNDEIRDAIFLEFATKKSLSKHELMQTSRLIGQKQSIVNAVLATVCDHIKVGPLKGDFQLKAEFGGA